MSLLLATAAPGGSVTGTIAWTQAGDSWALTSNVTVSGAIAVSQASDVWALTGAAAVSGAVSFLQSPDVWALSGNVTSGTVSGAISWTQSDDSWSLSGTVAANVPVAPMGGAGHPVYRKKVRGQSYYIDRLWDKVIAEMYGDLTEIKVPQKVQKQAAKIVKPFAKSGEKIPVLVDWDALERDAERVSMLLELWQKQVAEGLDDEDILLLGCI